MGDYLKNHALLDTYITIFYLDSWASQVGQVVKNPPANAREVRDMGLILELGRSPGGENGNPSSILPWRIP